MFKQFPRNANGHGPEKGLGKEISPQHKKEKMSGGPTI
jgi:hypothetical protein